MRQVYEKAMKALDECAEDEKWRAKDDEKVTVTFSLGQAIEVMLCLYLSVKEREERIQEALSRDRRLPSNLERTELAVRREAYEVVHDAVRGEVEPEPDPSSEGKSAADRQPVSESEEQK